MNKWEGPRRNVTTRLTQHKTVSVLTYGIHLFEVFKAVLTPGKESITKAAQSRGAASREKMHTKTALSTEKPL